MKIYTVFFSEEGLHGCFFTNKKSLFDYLETSPKGYEPISIIDVLYDSRGEGGKISGTVDRAFSYGSILQCLKNSQSITIKCTHGLSVTVTELRKHD